MPPTFHVLQPPNVRQPTISRLTSMDYAFQAQPFVEGTAEGTDLDRMDIAFQGQPFVIFAQP